MMQAFLFLVFLIVAFLIVLGLYANSVRVSVKRKSAELLESWDLLLHAAHDCAETLPKLVEDAKHTTGFEEKIFHKVLKTSEQLASTKAADKMCEAILNTRAATNDLYRIAEYYPRLEAEPKWLALKAEATEAEVCIERELGTYNRIVREFNRLISNSVAGRYYAQRANLVERETVEKHADFAISRISTSPIRLAPMLD